MKPLSILLLTASIAFAEIGELDPIVIQASEAGTLTQPTLEEDRLDLAKIPGGTETIGAERYLTGRSSTLADTFFLSPGIVAQPRFGSDEARISIRGSGLQRTFHGRGIRFMQDGIPLNLADGGFDMQVIDPLAASRRARGISISRYPTARRTVSATMRSSRRNACLETSGSQSATILKRASTSQRSTRIRNSPAP